MSIQLASSLPPPTPPSSATGAGSPIPASLIRPVVIISVVSVAFSFVAIVITLCARVFILTVLDPSSPQLAGAQTDLGYFGVGCLVVLAAILLGLHAINQLLNIVRVPVTPGA